MNPNMTDYNGHDLTVKRTWECGKVKTEYA
jgi:hypothetical protein